MAKRTLPDILTNEEQDLLLKEFNHRYPTSYRNYVMVKLMLKSGLRVSECLNLEIDHIDWMCGKLLVKQGKGKKDRILWLTEDILDHLRRWKELSKDFDRKSHTNNLLFTTLKGTPIITSYMRNMLKRISKRAGITKKVNPHLLRHCFGSQLYRNTNNLKMVQDALGHESITTTVIYTHLVNDDLKKAMREL